MARRQFTPEFGNWQDNQNFTGIFTSKKDQKSQGPQGPSHAAPEPDEDILDVKPRATIRNVRATEPEPEPEPEQSSQNYTQVFLRNIEIAKQNKVSATANSSKPIKVINPTYSPSDSDEDEGDVKNKRGTPDEGYNSEEDTITFPSKPVALPQRPTPKPAPEPQPGLAIKHTPVPKFDNNNTSFTAIFQQKKEEAKAQKPGRLFNQQPGYLADDALQKAESPKLVLSKKPSPKPSEGSNLSKHLAEIEASDSLPRGQSDIEEPLPERKSDDRSFEPVSFPKERSVNVLKNSAFEAEYDHAYDSSPSPKQLYSKERNGFNPPVPASGSKPRSTDPPPQLKITPRAPNKTIPPFPASNAQGASYTAIFDKMKHDQLRGGSDANSPKVPAVPPPPIPPPPVPPPPTFESSPPSNAKPCCVIS